MKYKTLFRLAMKVLGVVFVGLALPHVAGQIAQVMWFFTSSQRGIPPGMTPAWWWQIGLSSLGYALQLALGLYLLFGGKWLVDKAIPSNRAYCPECGYDLSAAGGDQCPECGVKLPDELRGG